MTKKKATRLAFKLADKLHIICLDRGFARIYRTELANPSIGLEHQPLYDVVHEFMWLENQVLHNDGTKWLEDMKGLDLSCSLRDLYRLQKESVEILKYYSNTQRKVHTEIIGRVLRLEPMVKDAYSQVGKRLNLLKYVSSDALSFNKQFQILAKLDSMILALDLHTKKDVSLFLYGVLSARMYQSRTPTLHVMASPLSVIDYLSFYRRNWVQSYVTEQERNDAKNKFFSFSYHEQCANEALALAELMIRDCTPGVDSRRTLEVRQGIGHYPMMVYYMVTSHHINELYEEGALKIHWPAAHSALGKLIKDCKQNPKLLQLLRSLRGRIETLWEDSGIPNTGDHDLRLLRKVLK